MTRPSSSTSNSESPPPDSRAGWRGCVVVGIGFLATILTFDLVVGYCFAVRGDESASGTGSLDRYFEYGRSVEGKVRRMVGAEGRQHPMFTAGWVERQVAAAPLTDASVTVYGQSFANHVAIASEEFLDGYEKRLIGGPGATLSHSYFAFLQDEHWQTSKVVVLGILASSLPKIQSMTHMTGFWEGPAPHTYPRYILDEGGRLRSIDPLVPSEEELRAALIDDSKWSEFVRQLALHDAFFDPLVFHSVLDGSASFRLLRRGWGQTQSRAVTARLHSIDGFDPEVVAVARAILKAFVARAREGGRPIVVMLFNDRGFADHLDKALVPVLEANEVHFVSSHDFAPAGNLANFVPDGHFRPGIERELGRRLAAAIREVVGR